MNLNAKRLVNTFLNLVQIDSESFHEKDIQEYVATELKKIGCRVQVDKAGSKFDTNARGNVLGFFPGTVKSRPFVLAAHLDTVQPGKAVKPQLKKEAITSDGTTILGADDKAGVAIILELLRTLKETKRPHPPVEVLFTLCEERGIRGAKNLDYRLLKGREGLILDNEEGTEMLIQGPAVNDIRVEITGLAAHAGVCPEKGISAIEVAAYALARMKLGRIDKDTVANFGVVQGGQVTNVVMEKCVLLGEARSLHEAKLAKQVKHMQQSFEQAVKHFTRRINGRLCKPKVHFQASLRYPAVAIPKSHDVVKLVSAAAKRQGIKLRLVASGGGCDANVLSGYGFTLPNLGVGVRDCHTTKEKLLLKEFYSVFELVFNTVIQYRK